MTLEDSVGISFTLISSQASLESSCVVVRVGQTNRNLAFTLLFLDIWHLLDILKQSLL